MDRWLHKQCAKDVFLYIENEKNPRGETITFSFGIRMLFINRLHQQQRFCE